MINGGIYIHVPFCTSKCYYCSFYSSSINPEKKDLYLKGIDKELLNYTNTDFVPETIYFGGGTPSLLEVKTLAKIMKKLEKVFDLSSVKEITIEVNPETVTREKVAGWNKLGFNRVSLGIQSFSNQRLKEIGRTHTKKDSLDAILLLKEKINNISGDLICGLPNQSLSDWEMELEEIIKYKLEHISIYPLQIELGTKLEQKVSQDYYSQIDDLMIEMMQMTSQRLKEQAYEHYEISNYAKSGFESKHNLIYWQYKPYLGIGPAAASFYKGERWSNVADIKKWAEHLKKEYDLDHQRKEVQMAEFVFLSLRLLNQGVVEKDFRAEFGVPLKNIYGETLKKLLDYGWLTKTKKGYKIDSQAVYFANQIFVEFLTYNKTKGEEA